MRRRPKQEIVRVVIMAVIIEAESGTLILGATIPFSLIQVKESCESDIAKEDG